MRAFVIYMLLGLSCTAYAQVPRTISYQGILTDAQGNLVPDGNHQLTLNFYDAATNGTALFTETQAVPVVNGVFNVIIGSVTPLPASLAFDRAYFLGVRVDGGAELSPRTPLTAVPYALRAATADVAQALAPNASGAVTSVNNQAGALSIQGAGGTTVTNNGAAFTISSTGSGGTGIQGVQNADGTIAVQDPNGPVATIGIPDFGITAQKINPAGATTGQAIVYNGTSVGWQTVIDGGIQSLQSADGTIAIENPAGPVAALGVNDGAIGAGKIANGNVVRSLNGLTDNVTLAASGGATITTAGNTITINAGSGTGAQGIQAVQNSDNALDILNPSGPTATINVKDQGITTAKIAEGAVTAGKLNTATSAAAGKILTATAGGMDWQTPASGVGGSGAADRVALWSGNNALSGDANFVFKDGKLGIGTANPNNTIEVANLINFGNYNSALGFEAMAANTIGSSNAATGFQAMRGNTSGGANTAHGSQALYTNNTSSRNSAFGHQALYATTGEMNTAAGSGTMFYNNSGSYNSGFGYHALFSTTSAQFNVAVGYNAGAARDNGYNNVFVGANTDVTGTGLFNVIAIGQATTVGASSVARFGNSATISYGGWAGWSNVSDARFKKDVRENVRGLDFIMKLRPVTYHLDVSGISRKLDETRGAEWDAQMKTAIAEKERVVQTGFIAQEVEEAAQSLGYEFSGVDAPKNADDLYGLRYAEFVVPLVKAVQELYTTNEALVKRIAALESQVEILTKEAK